MNKILKTLIIVVLLGVGLWFFFIKFLKLEYVTLAIFVGGLGLILGVAYFAIKGMIKERR